MRLLKLGFSAVFHQFRVAAGKDDEAVTPFGVPEATAPQQHVVVAERMRLGAPRERAVELVEQLVGRLALNVAVERGELGVVLAELRGLRDRLLHLQVRLAVQLRRFDVAKTVRLAARQ